jgi:hypothetical protein
MSPPKASGAATSVSRRGWRPKLILARETIDRHAGLQSNPPKRTKPKKPKKLSARKLALLARRGLYEKEKPEGASTWNKAGNVWLPSKSQRPPGVDRADKLVNFRLVDSRGIERWHYLPYSTAVSIIAEQADDWQQAVDYIREEETAYRQIRQTLVTKVEKTKARKKKIKQAEIDKMRAGAEKAVKKLKVRKSDLGTVVWFEAKTGKRLKGSPADKANARKKLFAVKVGIRGSKKLVGRKRAKYGPKGEPQKDDKIQIATIGGFVLAGQVDRESLHKAKPRNKRFGGVGKLDWFELKERAKPYTYDTITRGMHRYISERLASKGKKKSSTHVIEYDMVLETPDGESVTISGEAEMIYARGQPQIVRKFLDTRLYADIAEQLRGMKLVTAGSYRRIESLPENDGLMENEWTDTRGEKWGKGKFEQVEIVSFKALDNMR